MSRIPICDRYSKIIAQSISNAKIKRQNPI